MRTIIAGSRDIRDYRKVEQAVKNSGFILTEIVSGGARGVDRLGELYGRNHNIPITLFIPDWETIGKSAGFIRNRQMALQADCLIAVWDGKSKGTKHMIDTAREYNLDVYIEEVL
jgi:hypothetical protein